MLSYSQLWSIQEPLLAMAGVLEVYVHFSGRIKQWKAVNAEWWYRLQIIHLPNRHEVSQRFLSLFHTMYGERILSLRRVLASAVCSVFFVVITFWLVGRIGRTFFAFGNTTLIVHISPWLSWLVTPGETVPAIGLKSIAILVHDSLGLNVIPDFISIAETGWIISRASRPGSSLWRLFALDLLLTTLIWVMTHFIALTYTTAVEMGGFAVIPFWRFYVLDPAWVSYALTTYTTSMLWLAFLLSVMLGAFMKRLSSVAVQLLEARWVQEVPIMLMVGIPCAISWPVLFVAHLMQG